jgi:tRNA (pseudouridine54-N1)-methyltransferase
MREFIYYSKTAPTSGSGVKQDLIKSGRLDIAIHSIISSFFLSHSIREDVKLHLVFDGPPDPTKHLELIPNKDRNFKKSDISSTIKKMLYKYKEGEKSEVFPGFWVEKKSLVGLLKELIKEGKEIYLLDRKGENIRSTKLPENSVFLLGDHEGLPKLKKELKRIKDNIHTTSLGKKTYFASQTISILNNELDFREE